MILKFIIADAANVPHQHSTEWASLVRGDCEIAVPAAVHIVAGIERVEYGGPLIVDPATLTCLQNADHNDVDHEALRQLWRQLPSDERGWGEALDMRSRGEHRPDYLSSASLTYWVKAYGARSDEHGTPLCAFLHDTRAFLCDDRGQTLEKLGPR